MGWLPSSVKECSLYPWRDEAKRAAELLVTDQFGLDLGSEEGAAIGDVEAADGHDFVEDDSGIGVLLMGRRGDGVFLVVVGGGGIGALSRDGGQDAVRTGWRAAFPEFDAIDGGAGAGLADGDRGATGEGEQEGEEDGGVNGHEDDTGLEGGMGASVGVSNMNAEGGAGFMFKFKYTLARCRRAMPIFE